MKRSKEIAKIQTKYNLKKKQKENAILKLEVNKEKNVIKYISLIAILCLLSLFFIYSRYSFKQKANKKLKEKNQKI